MGCVQAYRRDLATRSVSSPEGKQESPYCGRDHSIQFQQHSSPRKNPRLCLRRRERGGVRGGFVVSGSGAHVILLLVVLVVVLMLVAYPGT